MAILSYKSYFLFIAFFNPYLIIRTREIELGKPLFLA